MSRPVNKAYLFAVVKFNNENTVELVPCRWVINERVKEEWSEAERKVKLVTLCDVRWPKLSFIGFSKAKRNADFRPKSDWISYPGQVLKKFREYKHCIVLNYDKNSNNTFLSAFQIT